MGMTNLEGEEIKYELPFRYKVTNILKLTNYRLNKRGFLRKYPKDHDLSETAVINRLGIVRWILNDLHQQYLSDKVAFSYLDKYLVITQDNNEYSLIVKIIKPDERKKYDNPIDLLSDVFKISLIDDVRSNNHVIYNVDLNIYGKPTSIIPRVDDKSLSDYEIKYIKYCGITRNYLDTAGLVNYKNTDFIKDIVECYLSLSMDKLNSFI